MYFPLQVIDVSVCIELQYIKICFAGVERVSVEEVDNVLIVINYNNINNESYHPSDYIQVPLNAQSAQDLQLED